MQYHAVNFPKNRDKSHDELHIPFLLGLHPGLHVRFGYRVQFRESDMIPGEWNGSPVWDMVHEVAIPA